MKQKIGDIKNRGINEAKKMNIKCVALDLDRTTLNKEGRLSLKNRTAIEEAIKNGIHVIIASGRAFDTLPEEVVSIPGIEYAITSNGAAMYSVPDKRCLKRLLLDSQTVEQILNVAKADTVTFEAFIEGVAYAPRNYIEDPVKYGATPQAVAYVQRTRHLVEDIEAFIQAHKQELDCMDIIVKEESQKDYYWKRLAKECKGIYVTSSIKQLLEISNEKAGKHSGVQYFMEKLGIKADEIVAFGDADNDVDMLRFVGTGIAVANASENCKQVADYISVDHNNDAIDYGLRELLHLI